MTDPGSEPVDLGMLSISMSLPAIRAQERRLARYLDPTPEPAPTT